MYKKTEEKINRGEIERPSRSVGLERPHWLFNRRDQLTKASVRAWLIDKLRRKQVERRGEITHRSTVYYGGIFEIWDAKQTIVGGWDTHVVRFS